MVDNFPHEITWTIENDLGEEVDSGGSYGGLSNGTVVQEIFCLVDGCYTFTMHDSYGDGICCGQGIGSYELYTFDLGTIVTGGNYDHSESTDFCVGITTQLEELSDPIDLSVVPNPSNGTFRLVGTIGTTGPALLNVFDATGRLVFGRDLLFTNNRIDESVYVTGVKPGFYIARLECNGAIQEIRLIIDE